MKSVNMLEDNMKMFDKCKQDPAYFVTTFLTSGEGNAIIPTQTQMNVLYMDSDNLPITGPRRSGKSTAALLKIFTYLCFERNFRIVGIASTTSTRNFMLDTIKRWIKDLPDWFNVKVKSLSPRSIQLTNGNSIEFVPDSIDSVNMLRGTAPIDLMFFDERYYTKFSSEILNKLSTFGPNYIKRILSTDLGAPPNRYKHTSNV